jgi:hypothetical protein
MAIKVPPKPKFVVDEHGKKSGVLLSIEDYERLMEAWEEVADADDFAEARRTTKNFISPDELRRRVLDDK